MLKLLRFAGFGLLALLFSFSLKAQYCPTYAGGEFGYKAIGGKKYVLTLTLYRNCSSCSALPGSVSVTSAPNSCNSSYGYYTFTRTNACEDITPILSTCKSTDSSVCKGGSLPGTQKCVYVDTVSLPCADSNWTFYYTGYYRDTTTNVSGTYNYFSTYCTINNFNYGSANTTSTSPSLTDSSDVYYVCPGHPASFSLGGSDPNGDSLGYSVVTPYSYYSSYYKTVISYNSGYSATDPIDASCFGIDSTTGQVTFHPTTNESSVMAVIITKYRRINGVLHVVGTIYRNIQIRVLSTSQCNGNKTPVMYRPTSVSGGSLTAVSSGCDSGYYFSVCPGANLSFTLPCVDSNASQVLTATTNATTACPGSSISISNGKTGNSSKNIAFSWTPSNTQVGTFIINVTLRDNNCPYNAIRTYALNITVLQPTYAGKDTTICKGQSTTLSVLGGTTFSWTSSSSSSTTTGSTLTVSPTVTTSYYVSSNNKNSCKSKDTVVVFVSPSFKLTMTPSVDSVCLNQVKNITVSTNTAGTYTYYWTSNDRFKKTPLTTDSAVGAWPLGSSKYYVRVVKTGGCTEVDSAYVKISGVAPPVHATVSPRRILCTGDSVQLNAFSPVSNSSYCIPPAPLYGCAYYGAIDSCILGSVTFFKGVGCNSTGYLNYGLLNSTCFNAGSSYTLTLGGSPGSYYHDGFAVWIDFNHDGVFQNSECVFLTDKSSGNCSPYVHSKSITIPAGAVPGRTKMRIMASICLSYYSLDTSMSCGATGNAGYYGETKDVDIMVCSSGITYSWSPSASVTNSTIVNPKAFPTSTTTYTVTATAGGSCSNSDTVSVSVVPSYTLTVSPKTDTLCYSKSVTLSSSTAPSSITTNTKWLLGSKTGALVDSGTSITFTPHWANKYIAMTTSTAGCVKYDSVNVVVLPAPTLHASAVPDTICLGDSVKLSAFSTSSSSACTYCSGRPLYNYCYSSYLLDSVYFGSLAYGDPGCGGLSSGYLYNTGGSLPTYNLGNTYTMTIIPNSGSSQMHVGVWIDFNHNCSLTDSGEMVYASPSPISGTTTVSIPIPLNAIPGKTRMRIRYEYYYNSPYWPYELSDACDTSSMTSGNSYSYGEVVDFDVNLFAPSVYTWSPATNPLHGGNVTAAPTTTTTYTVSYKNGTSCTGKDSIKVVVVPNFTISATPKMDTICYGHNDTLHAAVTISGYGFGIKWLSGSRTGSVISTSGKVPLATPAKDTKYILKVRAGSGCTKYDSAFIHVVPSPTLNPCATPDTICVGDSVTLKAFCSSSSSCSSYCTPNTFYSYCYSYYMLDSMNLGGLSYKDSGCVGISNGYKYVNNPKITATYNIGSTYTFKIKPNYGGTYEHLAVWIDFNHDCSFTSDSTELVYTSPSGPSSLTTFSVTIPNSAIPGKTRMRVMYYYSYNFSGYVPFDINDACDAGSTSSGSTIYYGEALDFDVTLYAPITYTWSPSTNPVHAATVKAAPTTTTTYTVSYKNGSSCSSSNTVTVTVVPNFTATVTPHKDTLCYGHVDTLKLTVSPGSIKYNAYWYAGSAKNGTGTYVGTGTKYNATPGVAHSEYMVKVAEIGGCTKYDSSLIAVLPSPVLAPCATPDTLCAGDSVTLKAFCSSSSCTYCGAATNYCYSFYDIDSVYIGGIGYYTSCSGLGASNGYWHITSPVQNDTIGNTYTVKVKLPSGYYNMAAWVDFNHNCSFTDTMEMIYNTTTTVSGYNTFTFTVPLGAVPGKTRMRIMYAGYSYSPLTQYDACDSGTFYYGQVVDIDLNLFAPITYTWSPATNPLHATVVKAAPTTTTTYTVSYKNGSSCSSSATVKVVVSPSYKTTVTPKLDSLCYGTSKSITGTASISGGNVNWYVHDTTTGVLSSGSPYSASPSVPTTYIALFDVAGCKKIDSSHLKVLPAPVLGPTASPRVICLGDSTTLGAFMTTSPRCFCPAWSTAGCGGYWVDTFRINSTVMVAKNVCNSGKLGYQYYSTPVFTALLGNTYTFTIVTNNSYSYHGIWVDFDHSCSFDPGELVASNTSTGTNTYAYSITIPMSAIPGLTRIRIRSGYCSTCYGGSGLPANFGCDTTSMYDGETDDFMLNITASGLGYSWKPTAAGIGQPTLATTKAAPTVNTTYTVSFSSSGVCKGSDTVSVVVVPNFTISVTPTMDSFCTAGTKHTASSSTQSIAVTLSPSSAGPFKIKWYLNDTTTVPLDTTNFSYTATTAKSGKYYMKISSDTGHGCTKLDSSVIMVLPFVNVGATASPNVMCPYNYTSLNSYAVGSSVSYCAAKTVYGCNYFSSYYKYYYAIDSFYFAGIIKNPGAGCNGNTGGYKYEGAYTNTCLSAGTTYHIAFGIGGILTNGGYRYYGYCNNYAVWIDFNHDGNFDASENVILFNNSSTPYTLKGTITIPTYTLPGNTRMRVRSSPGGIYSSSPLNANMGCDTTSVYYGSVQDYDICIDNSYLSYQWNPSTGVDASTAPSTKAYVTTTTTYTVTLTGYGGYCQSSDTASVKTPSVTLSAGPDTAVCAGNSVKLTGTVTGGGTTLWSGVNSSDNSTISSPTTLVTTVTPTATTSYVLRDSFSYGGSNCFVYDTVNVYYDVINPITPRSDTTTCGGNCINVTAPAGYNKYQWSPTALFTHPDSLHQKICLTTSSYIKLTVFDTHGCSSADSFKFTVSPIIWPTAHSDTCICPGGIATLNGGAGSSWKWSPSTGLSGLSTRIVQASPLTATTYTLTVRDVNGCPHDTTLSVCVYPGVTAFAGADTVLVYGTSGHLHASGGATYYWTPKVAISSQYAQSPVVSPTQTTTYYVLVTDSNTCTSTSKIVVNVTSQCLGMYMANAFSPDGDGLNDYAVIQGWGYDELVDCRIFNRWGQLVFQTTDKNQQWDGNYNGTQCEMGTYIYIIKSKCQNDVTVTKGNITLIR